MKSNINNFNNLPRVPSNSHYEDTNRYPNQGGFQDFNVRKTQPQNQSSQKNGFIPFNNPILNYFNHVDEGAKASFSRGSNMGEVSQELYEDFQNSNDLSNSDNFHSFQHGNPYAADVLAELDIESLGSRDINPQAQPDRAFDVEELHRRHAEQTKGNQATQSEQNRQASKNTKSEASKNNKTQQKEGFNNEEQNSNNQNERRTKNSNEGTGPISVQKAKEKLKSLDLSKAIILDNGEFNVRDEFTKEYLLFCKLAKEDPMEYYILNHTLSNEENGFAEQQHSSQSNNIQHNNSSMTTAKQKLGEFDLSTLVLTKDGAFFNMRNKHSKDYMSLCGDAREDPMDYYTKNHNQQNMANKPVRTEYPHYTNNLNQEDSGVSLAREKLREFDLSLVKLTQNGIIDKRYNDNKDYVALCVNAEEDPYDYYDTNYTNVNANNSSFRSNANQNGNAQAGANHRLENEVRAGVGRGSAIREELRRFDLSQLVLNQNDTFNMRYKATKDYFDLCEGAGEDPYDYYEKNYINVNISNNSFGSNENRNTQVKADFREVRSDLPAREELRRFDLSQLTLNKNETFNMRFNITKDYLGLCERAGEEPYNYYDKNFVQVNTANSSVRSDEGSKQSERNLNEEVESGLKLTQSKTLDMRFKSNKEYIENEIRKAKKALSGYDTTNLKKTKSGAIDKRYKENKEYLQLVELADENYYIGKKFV